MSRESLSGPWRSASAFIQARYGLRFTCRERLQVWQARRLDHFLRKVLPRAKAFRAKNDVQLADLPLMDKAILMADFASFNTLGLSLDEILPLARQAEDSRDFSATLGGVTVGLSSGTSGHQGVFLVSAAERQRWAGILLGRTLPAHLLGRLLCPWKAPLRIAFFLRANSRLYQTLSSRRIDFAYHDLTLGLEASLQHLQTQNPDVLVAPATVLRGLAEAACAGHLVIAPSHILSVAEVLEPDDEQKIQQAFGVRPRQIYQASEGFLGFTCEQGTLHLNEAYLHIEPHWLDPEQTRFMPIITDFSRHTQLIVRYRLNDVLRVADAPCPCGRAERAIAAVEGRMDDVLWLPEQNGGRLRPLYPDILRRTLLLHGGAFEEYSIEQRGLRWDCAIRSSADLPALHRQLTDAIHQLCKQQGLCPPELTFGPWQMPSPLAKRRRLKLVERPQGLPCMY